MAHFTTSYVSTFAVPANRAVSIRIFVNRGLARTLSTVGHQRHSKSSRIVLEEVIGHWSEASIFVEHMDLARQCGNVSDGVNQRIFLMVTDEDQPQKLRRRSHCLSLQKSPTRFPLQCWEASEYRFSASGRPRRFYVPEP